MSRKSFRLVCFAVILYAGCGHPASRMATKMSVDQARTSGLDELRQATSAYLSAGAGHEGGSVYAAGRFVAVRHKLEVVEPGSGLPKSIETVLAYCGTIQCEVLSSSVSNETEILSPSGNIAVRVAPQDLNKFLDFTGKQGRISQHSTESEDKTAAVVDVEAKIKNQTDFRDSLRKMLTKPGVNVADLLQIQEKLAEAQAELDSEATQRKMLANETEKVYVEVAFRSEQRITNRSAFAPISQALRDSGQVLAESLGGLIITIAAIIPWLIVIVPGIWVLVRFVRKLRRKRAESKGLASTS